MSNKDTLKPPFPPGVSGNPAGRTPGSKNRKTLLREAAMLDANDGKGGSLLDQIIRKQVAKAADGDPGAYDRIIDGIFGKLKESVETNHVFKQMGQIQVSQTEGSGEGAKTTALTFDVGSEAATNQEDDDDQSDGDPQN